MNVEKLWDMYVAPHYEMITSPSSAEVIFDTFRKFGARCLEEVNKSPMLRSLAIECLRLSVVVVVAYVAYKKGAEENLPRRQQPANSSSAVPTTQRVETQASKATKQDSPAKRIVVKPGVRQPTSEDLTSLDITFESVKDEEKVQNRRESSPQDKPSIESEEESDSNTVVKPRMILGPSVNNIKFLVSARPDQHLNVFAPTSYRSIRRLLEINLYNLTCSIHIPVDQRKTDDTGQPTKETATASAKSPTVTPNSTSATQKAKIFSEAAKDLNSREIFIPGKQFPLSSIVNVHADQPAKGVTLKITVELPHALLHQIPTSTVVLPATYTDPNVKNKQFVTPESTEKGPEFHPVYDVLRAHHNSKDYQIHQHIAKASGFEVSSIPLEDDLAALAVHGFTVDQSKTTEDTTEKRTETLEFVFQSAHDAALFQHYVFSLNLVGKEIRSLYNGLEFVNRIRIAKYLVPHILKGETGVMGNKMSAALDIALLSDPSLSVAFFASCSDDTKELLKKLGVSRTTIRGTALDDVSRCFCSIPFLEKRIQSFYDAHFPSWRTLDDYERSEVIDSTFVISSMQTGDKSSAEKEPASQTTADETTSTSVFAAAVQAQKVVSNDSSDAPTRGIMKGRCSIGFSDFIYLFVGDLPADASPMSTPSAGRTGIRNHLETCRHACILRKRVARAGLFTKRYVDAMHVVVAGWPHQDIDQKTISGSLTAADVHSLKSAGQQTEQVAPLKARVAFDDNLANLSYDLKALNEYYEATVGKDVTCNVHASEHLKSQTVSSKIQAYALVGLNVFRFDSSSQRAETDTSNLFSPENDPVLCIRSLYELIKSNPNNEFFVSSFFIEQGQVGIVAVFVRSLPYGIDCAFDNTVRNFKADRDFAQERQKKLELFVQLGPTPQLSTLTRLALRTVSSFWSWYRRLRGKSEIPHVIENGVERRPFPGCTLSRYTTTRHFKSTLPNYVAFTSHITALSNPIFKLLYKYLPTGVVDFSLVLKGHNVEELPERALGTVRVCQFSPWKVAYPIPEPPDFSNRFTLTRGTSNKTEGSLETEDTENNVFNLCEVESSNAQCQVQFPLLKDGDNKSELPILTIQRLRDQLDVDSRDLVCIGDASLHEYRGECEALVRILRDIVVPVKSLPATAFGDSEAPVMKDVPVLKGLSAFDLLRYIVASDFNLKSAAVSIVESAAWRGVTFPVNTRACRIELETGQFFIQGLDINENPVAYFQSMCPGPWRMDIDAQVLAFLHRLESTFSYWSKRRSCVQFTLVVLLGSPPDLFNDRKKKRKMLSQQGSANIATTNDGVRNGDSPTTDENNSVIDQGSVAATVELSLREKVQDFCNPRIDSDEEWQLHGNFELVQRLVNLATRHYPEIFRKLLLVPGGSSGSKKIDRYLKHLALYSRDREKITVIHSMKDLKKFIPVDELVTLAGGNAPVQKSAFDV